MTHHDDDEGVKAVRGLLVATGLTVLLCAIILIVWAL